MTRPEDTDIDRLIALLGDHDDPTGQIEAVRALAKIGDRRAVEPLSQLSRDPLANGPVRAAALQALADFGSVEAVPVLSPAPSADSQPPPLPEAPHAPLERERDPHDLDPLADVGRNIRNSNPAVPIVAIVTIVMGLIGVIVALGWPWKRIEELPPRPPDSQEETLREWKSAFQGEAADGEGLAGIHKLFADLGRALRTADPEELGALFDGERLYQEVRRLGALPNVPPLRERQLVRRIHAALMDGLAQNATVLRHDRFEIKHCRFLDDGSEALVYARMWRQDVSWKTRWWIVKRRDGWRMYDCEDLAFPIRASDGFAISFKESSKKPRDAARTQAALQDFRQLYEAVVADDCEAAEKALAKVDASELPSPIKPHLTILEAGVHLCYGRWQRALECCDRHEALRDKLDMSFSTVSLVRSSAYNGLERYAEARQAAERYIERFGADPDAYFQLGVSHDGLGQPEQAVAAFRKGLDDDPDSLDNLWGLGLVLPGDQMDEIGARFAEMRNPGDRFETVAPLFEEKNAWEALEALVKAHARNDPKDLQLAYYDVQVKVARGDHSAAAEVALDALRRTQEPERREYFRAVFLDSLLALKQVLPAYSETPDRDFAFGYLAERAAEQEMAGELDKLLAAHRSYRSDDLRLPIWEAEVKWLRKDYRAVVDILTRYREGAVMLADYAWRVQQRLVYSRVHLNELDEALAVAEQGLPGQGAASWLLAVVYAARRDVENTGKWLEECTRDGYGPEDFYADEILRSALRSQLFRKLRERYPAPDEG